MSKFIQELQSLFREGCSKNLTKIGSWHSDLIQCDSIINTERIKNNSNGSIEVLIVF